LADGVMHGVLASTANITGGHLAGGRIDLGFAANDVGDILRHAEKLAAIDRIRARRSDGSSRNAGNLHVACINAVRGDARTVGDGQAISVYQGIASLDAVDVEVPVQRDGD